MEDIVDAEMMNAFYPETVIILERLHHQTVPSLPPSVTNQHQKSAGGEATGTDTTSEDTNCSLQNELKSSGAQTMSPEN